MMSGNGNIEDIHSESAKITTGSSPHQADFLKISVRDRIFPKFPEIPVFQKISKWFGYREVSPLPSIDEEYDFLKEKEADIQDKVNLFRNCQPYASFLDKFVLLQLCQSIIDDITDYNRAIAHGIKDKKNDIQIFNDYKQCSQGNILRTIKQQIIDYEGKLDFLQQKAQFHERVLKKVQDFHHQLDSGKACGEPRGKTIEELKTDVELLTQKILRILEIEIKSTIVALPETFTANAESSKRIGLDFRKITAKPVNGLFIVEFNDLKHQYSKRLSVSKKKELCLDKKRAKGYI